MKVRVLKEYIGRNSGCLHKVGQEDEWTTVGKYGQALIDNGFVEVVNDNEGWRPKLGDRYFTPNHDGCGNRDLRFDDDRVDNSYMELGLAFKTDQEACKMAEWLKAVRVLRRDSEKSTDGGTKIAPYSVWLNAGCLMYHSYATSITGKTAQDNPFPFSTEKDVRASIKAHEKEWKTFFGVE